MTKPEERSTPTLATPLPLANPNNIDTTGIVVPLPMTKPTTEDNASVVTPLSADAPAAAPPDTESEPVDTTSRHSADNSETPQTQPSTSSDTDVAEQPSTKPAPAPATPPNVQLAAADTGTMSDANGDMRSNAGQSEAAKEQSTSSNPADQHAQTGGFDKGKFSDTLNKISFSRSQSLCATNVRKALEAAGVNTTGHPQEAKDWGQTLEKQGFKAVDQNGYKPQQGDIAVIQPYKGGNPSGHMAGFNGKQWVSDFKQKDYSPYSKDTPASTVYRFPDSN